MPPLSTDQTVAETAMEEETVLRPFYCELNALSRPDGSAMLTQGQTATVAGVYGPIEVKPNRIIIERACIEAVYRPKSGLPFVTDRMREEMLQKTFEAAIMTSQYPRTAISLVVQEMQDSGGLLACAINSACLAVMNSGLVMKFLVGAVHCIINADGEIILDPDSEQLKGNFSSLTFAFDNIDKSIISSHTSGKFTESQYQEARLKCQAASDKIFQFYRDIVVKYVPTIG